MTCIVAVTDDRYGAAIGGDSCTADDWHHGYTVATDQKVFAVGEFLIGASGDWRLMHLLRYGFEPPPHPDGMPDHAYMVVTWTAALRMALRLHGALKVENSVETIPESSRVLVLYRRRIYQLCENLQITAPGPYAAIGSGYAVALGALHATRNLADYYGASSVRVRVNIALEAAAEHTTTVRPPFAVLADPEQPARVGGYQVTFPSPEPEGRP